MNSLVFCFRNFKPVLRKNYAKYISCFICLEVCWACYPRKGYWTENCFYFTTFHFYNSLWQSHYILPLIQFKSKNHLCPHSNMFSFPLDLYTWPLYFEIWRFDTDLRHKWWHCLLFPIFSKEIDQTRMRSTSCVKGNIKDEALVEINLKVQEFILFFSAYLSFICVSLSVLAEMFILNKLMLSQIVSYV